MLEAVNTILFQFWRSFVSFLPDLFGGIIILVVGLIIAGLLKRLLLSLFSFFRLERFFGQARAMDKGEVRLWEEVLTELLRWTVVILFLIPTLEVWGLSRATVVLNQILLYIPNVIVAVVIGFVGIVAANLVSNLVRNSVRTLGATSANTLSMLSKTAIVFFTALIVLNQLGVAQQLIQILFTGIVGMLALAGGLAFGMGGRDMARELLDDLRRRLK